jgi:hypothetical protein
MPDSDLGDQPDPDVLVKPRMNNKGETQSGNPDPNQPKLRRQPISCHW